MNRLPRSSKQLMPLSLTSPSRTKSWKQRKSLSQQRSRRHQPIQSSQCRLWSRLSRNRHPNQSPSSPLRCATCPKTYGRCAALACAGRFVPMRTLPDAFASLRTSPGCEVVSLHRGATEGALISKGQAATGGAGHREGDDRNIWQQEGDTFR